MVTLFVGVSLYLYGQDAVEVGEIVVASVFALVLPRRCVSSARTNVDFVGAIVLVDGVNDFHEFPSLKAVGDVVKKELLHVSCL